MNNNVPVSDSKAVNDSEARFYPGKCAAIVLFILNIFLPGVGTMICGCCVGGLYGKGLICSGVIQLIFAPCIVGWVLSICSGLLFINQAGEKVPSDDEIQSGAMTMKQIK